MKYLLTLALVAIATFALSSCGWMSRSEQKAIAVGFKDIQQMAESTTKFNVPAEEVVPYIQKVAEALATQVDPENEFEPTKTAYEIYQGHVIAKENNIPNPALEKVLVATKNNINDISSIGWGAILGGGLLALGAVGKFMGGPWNIAGMGLQALGQRFVPDYDKYKKAAVGALASVDTALTQYGEMLDAAPETKKALQEKLGKDPVDWLKGKLKSAQTDLGTPEVSALLQTMKKEMTTQNGVLKPTAEELDKFLKKMVS